MTVLPPEGIRQGDCLEGLSRLPDSCVDMAFADPPFNLRKKYKAHKDQMEMDDYFALVRSVDTAK